MKAVKEDLSCEWIESYKELRKGKKEHDWRWEVNRNEVIKPQRPSWFRKNAFSINMGKQKCQ